MLKAILNKFVKFIISIESSEPITLLYDKPGPVILSLGRFTYTMVFFPTKYAFYDLESQTS